MAERKLIVKKRPQFRLPKVETETEEQDLKKVKAKALEEFADDKKKADDWLDKELEKNLKNQ